MSLKCQAVIIKTFKRAKAEVIWPAPGVTYPHAETCGGDVTVRVRAVDEPEWGGHTATMEVTWMCSRCRYPWVPGRNAFDSAARAYDGFDVTKMLEVR